MKAVKLTYWISTAIIGLMMTYSAYAYLTQPAMVQGFQHLGFPDYFRVELGIAKLTGAIVLIAPFSLRIREWAYAGFFFTFLSAFIAHTASGDPVPVRIMPLVFLAVLAVSYITLHKQHKPVSATALSPAL